MKLISIKASALLILSLFIVSCEKTSICTKGEGVITAKSLPIGTFSGVLLTEACDVIISQGDVQGVIAIGHPNIIERIKTDVKSNNWKIDFVGGCYKDYELTLYITVPNINYVTLSGSGDILINNFTNQGNLSLNISGSGEINLNEFDGAENLGVTISGSGDINANKAFSDLIKTDINISGSGTFDAFPIETNECIIDISGSGRAYISVVEKLDVNISGSGSVFYKGRPIVTSIISGSGNVINSN